MRLRALGFAAALHMPATAFAQVPSAPAPPADPSIERGILLARAHSAGLDTGYGLPVVACGVAISLVSLLFIAASYSEDDDLRAGILRAYGASGLVLGVPILGGGLYLTLSGATSDAPDALPEGTSAYRAGILEGAGTVVAGVGSVILFVAVGVGALGRTDASELAAPALTGGVAFVTGGAAYLYGSSRYDDLKRPLRPATTTAPALPPLLPIVRLSF